MAASPRSIASVRSQGGTPPASPSSGSTSSTRTRVLALCELAIVSRMPSRAPLFSPIQSTSRATTRSSRSTPFAAARDRTHNARSFPLGATEVLRTSPPPAFTASSNFFEIAPPPPTNTTSVESRGFSRNEISGERSARLNRPTFRATTTLRSVRKGGVWAASTTDCIENSASSNSSTIIDESLSPTSSFSSSRTAVRSTDSSSPLNTYVVISVLVFSTNTSVMPIAPGDRNNNSLRSSPMEVKSGCTVSTPRSP